MSHTQKSIIRRAVWPELRKVAKPDSRFHYDFSSFIADFEDSRRATTKLMELPCYLNAKIIFITPDNCLEELRYRALDDGKTVLTTTYGIRRGFWLLDPKIIRLDEERRMASMLDGMEKVGRPWQLSTCLQARCKIDLLVTGTGAINFQGVRFGKGHGFFDIEHALLSSIEAVDRTVPCVAVVHDCQVLDEELEPEVFDTVCDIVVTPSRVIEVDEAHGKVHKPTCGILWERLQPGMLEDIPPLRELRELEDLEEKAHEARVSMGELEE